EARTYRYRGHSMSDPATYRTKEELEKYKQEDPITDFKAILLAEGKMDEAQFQELDKEAKRLSAEAVRFAEESPDAPLADLHKYTFVNGAEKGEKYLTDRPSMKPWKRRCSGTPMCS